LSDSGGESEELRQGHLLVAPIGKVVIYDRLYVAADFRPVKVQIEATTKVCENGGGSLARDKELSVWNQKARP
jgi:hypothetical protein